MVKEGDRKIAVYVGSSPTLYHCIEFINNKRKEEKTMDKEIEKYKEENCSKCTKNIDCKIIRRVDGKLTCTEEE